MLSSSSATARGVLERSPSNPKTLIPPVRIHAVASLWRGFRVSFLLAVVREQPVVGLLRFLEHLAGQRLLLAVVMRPIRVKFLSLAPASVNVVALKVISRMRVLIMIFAYLFFNFGNGRSRQRKHKKNVGAGALAAVAVHTSQSPVGLFQIVGRR